MQLFSSSWFRRKPISLLIGEMNDGERLKRNLGPVALTALGMGATIGTGLYVLTGEAAHDFAGPSLMLSFLLAGLGCCFAAMCYSELASMVPVAGERLHLRLCHARRGGGLDHRLGPDPGICHQLVRRCQQLGRLPRVARRKDLRLRIDPRLLSAPWDFDAKTGSFLLKNVTLFDGQVANAWINLPAVVVTLLITVVLVVGIRESAGFNVAMVILNLAVILTFIGVGMAYLDPRNWRPFLHEEKGWIGIPEGAARIFFAYIGFDSISTHAEEARNPQRDLADRNPQRRLAICTVLYVAVTAVLTGMVPLSNKSTSSAPLAAALHSKGTERRRGLDQHGDPRRDDQHDPRRQSEPVADPARDVARRHAAGRASSARSTHGSRPPGRPRSWSASSWPSGAGWLRCGSWPISSASAPFSRSSSSARPSGCSVRIDPHLERPFRTPWVPFVATMGILINGGLMLSPRPGQLDPPDHLAPRRDDHLLRLQPVPFGVESEGKTGKIVGRAVQRRCVPIGVHSTPSRGRSLLANSHPLHGRICMVGDLRHTPRHDSSGLSSAGESRTVSLGGPQGR